MTGRSGLRLRVDGVDVAPAAIAATFGARTRGLLGQREVHGALLIEPCGAIHTLGMAVPIDVAFCDAELRVLAVRTVTPWRPLVGVKGTRAVVEAAAGACSRWRVEPGCLLEVVAPGGDVLADRAARKAAGRPARTAG